MKRTNSDPATQRILNEINAIPRDALPDGPARNALCELVASGADCYVAMRAENGGAA